MRKGWTQIDLGSRPRWRRDDGALVRWDDSSPNPNPENPLALMFTAWEPDPSEKAIYRTHRGSNLRSPRRWGNPEQAMLAIDRAFPLSGSWKCSPHGHGRSLGDLPAEQWREVSGFRGYAVSDQGRVKRLGGAASDGRQLREIILATAGVGTRRQYKKVQLHRDGKAYTRYVHILVATAFVPNVHSKPTVNHEDGDTSRNVATNLSWATKKEQTAHAIRIGLIKRSGEDGCFLKVVA